jgi:hypothetical protein
MFVYLSVDPWFLHPSPTLALGSKRVASPGQPRRAPPRRCHEPLNTKVGRRLSYPACSLPPPFAPGGEGKKGPPVNDCLAPCIVSSHAAAHSGRDSMGGKGGGAVNAGLGRERSLGRRPRCVGGTATQY